MAVAQDGRSRGKGLVALEDVQRLVLGRCKPLPPTDVALDDAFGCVLAADVAVEQAVPPFANSAMDGYAVRAIDTAEAPNDLRVVGFLAAGDAPSTPVGPGEAIQIMTGAPLPDGATGIAIVERCEELPGEGGDAPRRRVRVLDAVGEGAHVRPAGSDLEAGSLAAPSGAVLTPALIGVIASAGAAHVRIVRRPRVGVMSTGDELVEVGDSPLGPGQIRDSNRHALLASVRRDGFEAVDLGSIRDREADVAAAFDRALLVCDAVLSSGGVSMGELDYVKVVLDRKVREARGEPGGGGLPGGGGEPGGGGLPGGGGPESFLLSLAIRPAKPLALGFLPRPGEGESSGQDLVPFFGLPGNPVSSLVSYQVVALPGLRALAGHKPERPRTIRAVAGEDLRRNPGDGKLHLQRVRASWTPGGRLSLTSAGGQMSHQLGAMSAANALALLPDGSGARKGEEVDAILFGSVQ